MTRQRMNQDCKITRVKLYKSGKVWVAALMTLTGVGMMTVLPSTPTFATVETNSAAGVSQDKTGTTSTSQLPAGGQQNAKVETTDAEGPSEPATNGVTLPDAKAKDDADNNDLESGKGKSVDPVSIPGTDGSTDGEIESELGADKTAKPAPTPAGSDVMAGDSVPEPYPSGAPKSPTDAELQAMDKENQDAGLLVTDKDGHGNYSVDSKHTGAGVVNLDPKDAAEYFEAHNRAKKNLPIDDTGKVQLTDGTHDMIYVPHSDGSEYNAGLGLLTANQKIDFKADFTLNVTMSAYYDPGSMKYLNQDLTPPARDVWLGGDGTSLFFAPLNSEKLTAEAQPGENLGLPRSSKDTDGKVISFNISTNARHRIAGLDDKSQAKQWYVYQANDDALKPVGKPFTTGIKLTKDEGKIAYNFDIKYTQSDRQIVTQVKKVRDDNDPATITNPDPWTYTVPESWSENPNGYTMAVSASIADSRATYTAQINSYSYTPVTSTLNIKASGLPKTDSQSGTKDLQSGIKAMAGNTVAFYPAGEAAVTADANGVPVTKSIAMPDIDGYMLKDSQIVTVGADNGKGGTDAILEYAKRASFSVNYYGDDGTKLQDAVVKTGPVGGSYDLGKDAPTFEGYTFETLDKFNKADDDKFIDGPQTVTYLYKKNPIASPGLTTSYLDENGRTIAKQQVLSGNQGKQYTVVPAAITGYTFKKVGNSSASQNGQLGPDVQEINFIYSKDPVVSQGAVANYLDENGRTIAVSDHYPGNIGDSYDFTPVSVAGHTFRALSNDSLPAHGQLGAKASTVNFIYSTDPVASPGVTANYLDENGRTIAISHNHLGNVGDSYNLAPVKIAGHTFRALSNDSVPAHGQLGTDAKATVNFIYSTDPVASPGVTANYFDENGRTIAVSHSHLGNVGDSYDLAPIIITGHTFRALSNDSLPAHGQLGAQAAQVNFIYSTDPVPGKSVTVRYVDTNGNVIYPDKTINGNIGDQYTEAPLPDDATYAFQGVANESGPRNGLIGDAPQTVIFVYEKKAKNDTPPTQDSNPSTTITTSVPDSGLGGNATATPESTPIDTTTSPVPDADSPATSTTNLPATGGTLPTASTPNRKTPSRTVATTNHQSGQRAIKAHAYGAVNTGVKNGANGQTTLPQTGNQFNEVLQLAGLILVGLMAVVGIKARRRED